MLSTPLTYIQNPKARVHQTCTHHDTSSFAFLEGRRIARL